MYSIYTSCIYIYILYVAIGPVRTTTTTIARSFEANVDIVSVENIDDEDVNVVKDTLHLLRYLDAISTLFAL